MSRRFWIAGAVTVLLGVTLTAWNVYRLLLPPGWVGFGATPAECLAAFHTLGVSTTSTALVSPRTRGYVAGGWTITAGFDEQDRTELFVYSKPYPLMFFSKDPEITKAQQQMILDKFRGSSAWTLASDGTNGPVWQRDDQQAFASYIASQHWVVLMNREAMSRQMKRLPSHPPSAEPPRGLHGALAP